MAKIGLSKSFWTTLVRKDWKKCRTIKIGGFESFQTTLVLKEGDKCEMTKFGQFQIISDHFGGKR